MAIPYEGTTLPAFLFRAPAPRGEPRPLVVVNRGCDEPTSAAWALGGAAAAERGYHWMTFDGPGQQAALVEQGLTARPDWEHVLTPVVDAMLARADVDPGRLAVIGSRPGGPARAARARLRAPLRRRRGRPRHRRPGRAVRRAAPAPRCARTCAAATPPPSTARCTSTSCSRPTLTASSTSTPRRSGCAGGSRFELFCAVARYRLGSELDGVRTPLLVVDEGDDRWPGQARELFDRLPGAKRLVERGGDPRVRLARRAPGLSLRSAAEANAVAGY